MGVRELRVGLIVQRPAIVYGFGPLSTPVERVLADR